MRHLNLIKLKKSAKSVAETKEEHEQWLIEKAKVHFDIVQIANNASKLAIDRLNQFQLSETA